MNMSLPGGRGRRVLVKRNHRLALATMMALASPLMAKAFPSPQARVNKPLVKMPSFGRGRRWYGKKPPVNGAKECARRVRQMAAGQI